MYLVLAAKYESWRLPLAVILVVPMCLLAAVTGMGIARLPVDIFVQIGFLVLVGMACKNAILIVEFARGAAASRAEEGYTRRAAEAARIRFRPIVMTSLAFIGGVFPLVIATGAGAEMRQSLGTAVFSGMIGVALFGIFLTPVFFFALLWFGGRKQAGTSLVAQSAVSAVEMRAACRKVRPRRSCRRQTRSARRRTDLSGNTRGSDRPRRPRRGEK